MNLSALKATTARNALHADAPANPPFLIASANPERWQGTFHEQLGLQSRVLPAPLPASAEARKVSRLSMIWTTTLARLYDAPADVALKRVRGASAKTFNFHQRKPVVSLAHLDGDVFDPGRKLMRAAELASVALFDRAADGSEPNLQLIETVASDLLAFHKAHHDVNDVRFEPIRLMGRCLHSLARILREAD